MTITRHVCINNFCLNLKKKKSKVVVVILMKVVFIKYACQASKVTVTVSRNAVQVA